MNTHLNTGPKRFQLCNHWCQEEIQVVILLLATRQETHEDHIFLFVAEVAGKIEYGEIDGTTTVPTPTIRHSSDVKTNKHKNKQQKNLVNGLNQSKFSMSARLPGSAKKSP